MAARITIGILLKHLQAMKYDLQMQITNMDRKFDSLDSKVDRLAIGMRQGFADAKAHRQALQEDLEATIQ